MKRINKTEEYILYYNQFLALKSAGKLKEGSTYHILDLPDGQDLIEGLYTVKKAEQDAQGNIIHETYVKRLDLDYQVVDSLPADKTAGKMIYLKDDEFKLENLKISNGTEYKQFIPTKTSDLTNDSQFATEEYVQLNGGKIDKLYLNSQEQVITNKSIDLIVNKTTVGLSNVDNTSDVNKPISTAVQEVLDNLDDKISDEEERALAAEKEINDKITQEINTRIQEHEEIQSSIDAINEKIPAQASATNQLADKDFVNSSINSYAATFKGSYATKAALDAIEWQTEDATQSTYVTNNDYAYIEADESHNNEAWRYIYVKDETTSEWQPQFKVNNTPFTAAQLAAINSNATADLINQISVNKQDIINTNNKFDDYLPLNGGTLKGVLYTEASTPYFIGKNKKVGMRAVDENNTVVGQFFVSDSAMEQYNGYYSGFLAQGNDGKNYALRISANGPVYRYDSTDHPIALKEDLNSKQDTINDLDTIRSGASAGATAVQPNTLTSYYTKTETDELLDDKVEKENGKGLSTNDYTDEEKEKLANLSNYSDVEIRNLLADKVDKTTTINNKPLSSNINLTASDIGALPSDTELFSGDYKDLNNKPTIPTTASQVNALPDTTNYGADLSLTIDTTTYVVTAQLKDQNGANLGEAKTIDLPLETVVVNGSYDSTNKKVILTLKDGSTIDFSVADLVSGLVSDTITIAGIDLKDNITSAELSNALNLSQYTNAVTSVNGQTGAVALTIPTQASIDAKYTKPASGIPATDLAEDYITETELNNKGYATTSAVNTAITNAISGKADQDDVPKLYSDFGENTDGSIAQSTVTQALGIVNSSISTLDGELKNKYTKPATGIPASDLAESYVKYDENSSVDGSDIPNADYLLKSAVVQTTGTSTTSVMSQKAVTDAINEAIQQSIIRALGGSY